ncbi:N-acetylmuramoyl-L-alanine amidase [Streptomyces sp. NBC_00083]|uniref:peptidoglycan recognition protein family protein n=1 Tax=Streptomyces sp. NBC_00083 TaxID=2975647 RepID=UPI00225B71BF|nr:N-acetylmuramoyl-L-alanine amidase [Streptomyces sp. NBC_00083]MCX5382082.1 N-acetylmuramoyl-L-alanine amidase [Streptomyces sp. NBC_00083]
MRSFLASSIGVAAIAALALPLAATAPVVVPAAAAEPAGSTQSLPLAPLPGANRSAGGASQEGLAVREVRPFSLVGVVWDNADDELHGSVQVRTRARAGGAWSAWQDLETHNHDHGADPGTAEAARPLHGSTAPLWVGDSDAVEARVDAEPAEEGQEAAPLPGGLRLDLVDPGADPAEQDAGGSTRAAGTPDVLPALDEAATQAEAAEAAGSDEAGLARPYVGPRPRIITRKGWGADERLRERGFVYTRSVKVAFVHHTASGNGYSCAQSASVLRSIYRFHVKSSGWRDIGYNFAVDKCGNIFEGRAGGVTKAVLGAHTLGFNTDSTGIAVLGTYNRVNPSAAALKAVEQLAAWKLGLYGVNPRGKSTLVSGGGNRYRKGRSVKFNAIAGHRDGFATDCPGARLYSRLGTARVTAAHYQGRR